MGSLGHALHRALRELAEDDFLADGLVALGDGGERGDGGVVEELAVREEDLHVVGVDLLGDGGGEGLARREEERAVDCVRLDIALDLVRHPQL